MSLVGFLIIIIFAAVVIMEMARGTIRALTFAGLLFISLHAAGRLYLSLGKSVVVFASATANYCFWYVVVFLFFATLSFLGSHFIHLAVAMDLEQFEQAAGAVLGVASAVMICHAFVKSLDIAYSVYNPATGGYGSPQWLLQDALANEMLNFNSWHGLMKWVRDWQQETGA